MRISDWSSDVCSSDLALSLPLLSACDAINDAPPVRKILSLGEKMHFASQRALTDRDALAREFSRADISPVFRPNGTRLPAGEAYAAHAARGFADWRVAVKIGRAACRERVWQYV